MEKPMIKMKVDMVPVERMVLWKWEELSSCAPLNSFHTSDPEAKMGDELTLLLEVFHKIEKAGGQATLSIATGGGKTKMKLEIGTTLAPPTESSSTSSLARRRNRRRGPQAGSDG